MSDDAAAPSASIASKPQRGRRGQVHAVLLAVLVSGGYMYPPFLTGSMAVVYGAELGYRERDVGLFISLFFVVAALFMPVAGRWAETNLPQVTRVAQLGSAACLFIIAVEGGSRGGWLVAMAVGGLAAAFAAPLGSLLIVRNVRQARQPMAFAIERSSIPASTLLSGLTVATLAPVLPWRAVFALGGVVLLFTVLVPVPQDVDVAESLRAGPRNGRGRRVALVDRWAGARRQRTSQRRQLTPLRPLLVTILAFSLCAAAASAFSAFFVGHAVELGLSPASGGAILAVGSAVTIGARLALGVGRSALHSRFTIVLMIALGAVGFVLLALPQVPTAVVGALLACGAGWGWTGVLSLAVVTAHQGAPGLATGLLQAGGSVGSVVGPLAFAALVERSGYDTGWAVSAAAVTVGAILMLAGSALWTQPSPAPSHDDPVHARAPKENAHEHRRHRRPPEHPVHDCGHRLR